MGLRRRAVPPVIARRVFPPDLVSVHDAREFVVAAVADFGPDMTYTARLLTSELVTNALIHARTDVEVTARKLGAGVRIEVVDHNVEPPVHASVATDAINGRGLQMVD